MGDLWSPASLDGGLCDDAWAGEGGGSASTGVSRVRSDHRELPRCTIRGRRMRPLGGSGLPRSAHRRSKRASRGALVLPGKKAKIKAAKVLHAGPQALRSLRRIEAIGRRLDDFRQDRARPRRIARSRLLSARTSDDGLTKVLAKSTSLLADLEDDDASGASDDRALVGAVELCEHSLGGTELFGCALAFDE